MRFENFLISLEIMWKGMLSIFIVMLFLAGIVWLLSKIQSKNK